ncbi:hypothetical protein TNCV_2136661 [Trichonephila clavipes]|nr:hypothetical protein TNCV_2136661 [Trichonephila clavipes]
MVAYATVGERSDISRNANGVCCVDGSRWVVPGLILRMDEYNLDQAPQDINEEFQLERIHLQSFVAATDPGGGESPRYATGTEYARAPVCAENSRGCYKVYHPIDVAVHLTALHGILHYGIR